MPPTLTDVSDIWTPATADRNVLTACDRKIVIKFYGPVKEGEHWRARRSNRLKDVGGGFCTAYKITASKMVGSY
jgi:hypothetical protein